MARNITALIALFGVALLGVEGCAAPTAVIARSQQLTHQAAEFNEAAAVTDRQLIVRNVLRARDRETLAFTRLTNFRSQSAQEIRGGFSASLGEGSGNDTLGPSASVAGSSSPAFDFPVQTGQSFQRAIHTPINLSIYRSLIEQGWQPGLLHMLLIERMRLSCSFLQHVKTEYREAANPAGQAFYEAAVALVEQSTRNALPANLTEDQEVALQFGRGLAHCGLLGDAKPLASAAPIELFNDPDDNWQAHVEFRRWVRALMSGGDDFLRICTRREQPSFGPALTAGAPVDLGDVVAVAGAPSLSWTPSDKDPSTPDIWQLRRTSVSHSFGMNCAAGSLIPEDATESDPSQIQVRSLEGVIYYLGEVVRVAPRDGAGAGVPGHTVTIPLQQIGRTGSSWGISLRPCSQLNAINSCEDRMFALELGADRDAVVVRHHGQSFSAPYTPFGAPRGDGSHGDRTQQVIELTLQLLGMLQEAQDLPTTPVVAVAR